MGKYRFYIVIAALFWGITGIFVNGLSPLGFSELQLVGARSVLNAILIALLIAFKDRALFKIKLRDIWVFIGSGVMSFAFFSYCYYASISENGMAIAAVLLYTAPIFVSVFSALIFKVKFTLKKVISLTFAVAGCALVSGIAQTNSALTLSGILFGLGSGVGYALYSVFGKIATEKGYSSITVSFYTFLFSSFITLPLSLSAPIPPFAFTFKGGFLLIAYAALTGMLPYLAYTKGLSRIEPTAASIIATAEPVVAAIFGIVLFGESLSLSAAAGIILIFASILFCTLKKPQI